ncbi:MAG TPA: hypothetical protein VFA66_07060 [Gaiellaceae bacterium]|nr:hypothetical protein [Gaiellaceae bacterium]
MQCLLLLLLQDVDASAGNGEVAVGLLTAEADLLLEDLPEQLGVLGVEPDVAPLLLDVLLDQLDRDGLLQARCALLVAPDAEEVLVTLPVAVGRLGDHQTTAAAPTPDRPFEIVVVSALLLAGQVVRGQDLLNTLEQLVFDQLRVAAVVLDPAPREFADVVAVPEHPVHVRPRQGLLREVLGGYCRQSLGGQSISEAAKRPLTGRVGLERPAHQRRTVGVELDRCHVMAVDPAMDVKVADRRPADRAAATHLHDLFGLHLLAEVARVPLVDHRQQPLVELAGSSVVNGFGAGDELDAGLLERERDLDIVEAVTDQPIQLVHDHIADVLLLDIAQQLLELTP